MSQPIDKLTDRERQILVLLAAGLRNREIASELSISEATVENHLHNAYGKLGVSNRVQAALVVVSSGILLEPNNEGIPS